MDVEQHHLPALAIHPNTLAIREPCGGIRHARHRRKPVFPSDDRSM
jgi:hypothetical protein